MKSLSYLFAATVAVSMFCSCGQEQEEKIQPSANTIERFVGVAVWADGICNPQEEKKVEEFVNKYSIDKVKFIASLQTIREAMDSLREEQYEAFLSEVDTKAGENRDELFDNALQVVVCDKEIKLQESARLLNMAKVLGIKPELANLLIADKIKSEKDAKIIF